jgi:hypothetical protein
LEEATDRHASGHLGGVDVCSGRMTRVRGGHRRVLGHIPVCNFRKVRLAVRVCGHAGLD